MEKDTLKSRVVSLREEINRAQNVLAQHKQKITELTTEIISKNGAVVELEKLLEEKEVGNDENTK